jgi:hypothetical protein
VRSLLKIGNQWRLRNATLAQITNPKFPTLEKQGWGTLRVSVSREGQGGELSTLNTLRVFMTGEWKRPSIFSDFPEMNGTLRR